MSSRTKFFTSHPQDGALAEIPDGKPCWALTAKIAKGTADGVLVLDMTHACDVLRVYGDQLSPTLQARMGTGGNQVPVLQDKEIRRVRKLTPTECERLQGLPDGYTDIEFKGKPASDARRYKAIGNGMAQPCADFVLQQIVKFQ